MITRRPSSVSRSARSECLAAGAACLIALAAGCSSLNLEDAKKLGALGGDAAGVSAEAILVSHAECQRAWDAEAFFHGYSGAPVPAQLLADYRTIQTELVARKQVFAQLDAAYEAFHSLAAHDAAADVGGAVNRLGEAVNAYAAALRQPAPVSSADKDALAKLGGLAGAEIQKRKIKASSALIRERLAALTRLLERPQTRLQLTSFKASLSASRSSALQLLWEKGLLDPSPLINEMGNSAGLKASKDAAKIAADPKSGFVKEGLTAVVTSRMDRRMDLIVQSYDASVRTIKELAGQHERLEAGETANWARLSQLVTELTLATDRMASKATDLD